MYVCICSTSKCGSSLMSIAHTITITMILLLLRTTTTTLSLLLFSTLAGAAAGV